jgi:hypothetical protein
LGRTFLKFILIPMDQEQVPLRGRTGSGQETYRNH